MHSKQWIGLVHLFMFFYHEFENLRIKKFMQQKRIFKNGMSQATEFQLAIAEWPAISSPIPFLILIIMK